MNENGVIHFIGIGGIGMSGIARLLMAKGATVSGSDAKESAITRELRELGAKVWIGHEAANVRGVAQVVTSTAIAESNPELSEARATGIPVVHRSQKLAELVNAMRGVTIAGTHGKTTTSSMAATVLRAAGISASYAVGGIINGAADNARVGTSDWFVVESDESDGTLVNYHAEVAVLTNVELDHTDFYKSMEQLDEVFRTYARNLKPGGVLVYCRDDEGARRIVDSLGDVNAMSYGLAPGARITAVDVRAEGTGHRFMVRLDGRDLGEVALHVPGRHNVLNALAVIGAALHVGADFESIARGLSEFAGVQRRFQFIGERDGVTVVDDYAHHPTEIRATLAAARSQNRWKRVVALFQPHRYSRTESLATEFGAAFGDADIVVVTNVYGAGEAPIAGVDSHLIVDELRRQGHVNVHAASGLDAVEDLAASLHQPGDLVITMGAGDIYKVAQGLCKRMAAVA